jgi:transglutaminase-like putative cysteine protease
LQIIRQGAIRAELSQGPSSSPPVTARSKVQYPQRALPKRLNVVHRTVYRYQRAVERSMHVLRVTPFHDRMQRLISNEISFSVQGRSREYEDVFGNQVRRIRVDSPFTELAIEARSQVELLDTDPLGFQPLHARSTLPLVWMPWQRHMLAPYLLPTELPDSELSELTEYAMSFVKRHDYDLLDTLLDLNETLFREYRYEQGTTTLSTTPFQVYTSRRGVCQDYANLFICLARLLGVPARYVCGYLFTGDHHPNQAMALASHAWAQVYLPELGWRGFDPTNGVLTQTDHVRVAVGLSFSDATPTSGTIFVGGGQETLEVDVKVTRAD